MRRIGIARHVAVLSSFPCIFAVASAAAGSNHTRPPIPTSTAHPELRLGHVRYDGYALTALVLVGASGSGHVVFDRRMVKHLSVTFSQVLDCETHRRLVAVGDDILRPVSAKNLLVLESGFWYGRQLEFELFPGEPSGPECIDVDLTYYIVASEGSLRGETKRVRAMRRTAVAE